MPASLRPAPHEPRQLAGDRAAELSRGELLHADPEPPAGRFEVGLRACERGQLAEREVEHAAADADSDDLDRDPGVADPCHPDVVEPLLEQRAEAVWRE